MRRWIAIAAKEVRDALRDRRTLAVMMLTSVLAGPLVLLALSNMLASLEARAERRVVVVDGIEHAPSLRNHFERNTYSVQPAPARWQQLLRESRLGDPVLVVGADFSQKLRDGEFITLQLVSHSANRQAESAVPRVRRLVSSFGAERGNLQLALRGVSPDSLSVLDVDEIDLASARARAARLFGIVPLFVLMAMLYGALGMAIDTTAGERERGSLEPLLGTPVPRSAIVLGKWIAAGSVSLLIAAASVAGFVPTQALLGESMQAMFRFGLREAMLFMLILVPLGLAFSALLLAVAAGARSVREAQAACAVLMLLAGLLPLASVFSDSGESDADLRWPVLAQQVLMSRVLRGDTLQGTDFALPLLACTAIAGLALARVARVYLRPAG